MKGAGHEQRYPLDLTPVLADAYQLKLALLNLAVNARDAMPDGGPIEAGAAAEQLPERNALDLAPDPYVRLT